jgi:hypothetical protein
MTIWLDQFLIGIFIGDLLSAADATDTDISVVIKAANTTLHDLELYSLITSYLYGY